MKNPINVIDALSATTEVVKAVGERYGQHMAQKHELVKINQQYQQERMNMRLMVAGTLAAEAVKLGTSIMAHNQACKRIDAELATATQGHERQRRRMTASTFKNTSSYMVHLLSNQKANTETMRCIKEW